MAAKNKFKPCKGIKKRVRFSATGKVKYAKPGMRKLMSGKRGARKLKLNQPGVIRDPAAESTMQELAGLSF